MYKIKYCLPPQATPFICPECSHESGSYLSLLRHVGQLHKLEMEMKAGGKRTYGSASAADTRMKRLKSREDGNDMLGFQVY